MTDREPFVRIEVNHADVPCLRVGEVDTVLWQHEFISNADLVLARDLINAAFNKRLDEEIAKAMEPLVHELKRLMDVVGEEDHKLIGDVVAEWERGK